jgi:hypothetical protein
MVVPPGLARAICPEPAAAGTVIVIPALVTPVGIAAGVMFRTSLLLAESRSKLVPVRTTELADAAICGVKESIRGAPPAAVTVKDSDVVTLPAGEEIVRGPVVAPEGTETTNWVADAELIVALVPLNVTVSWAGLELKFDPETITLVPTGPDFGLNVKNAN